MPTSMISIRLEHTLEYDKLPVMDRWMLSRLESTVKAVDTALDNYQIPETCHALQDLVDDMSNWYVRRSRARFWAKGHGAGQGQCLHDALHHAGDRGEAGGSHGALHHGRHVSESGSRPGSGSTGEHPSVRLSRWPTKPGWTTGAGEGHGCGPEDRGYGPRLPECRQHQEPSAHRADVRQIPGGPVRNTSTATSSRTS